MVYLLTGNTFDIKEELKSHGCSPVYENGKFKGWETPPLEKDEFSYLKIESLANAFGFDMNPIELSSEAQKIQDILNK